MCDTLQEHNSCIHGAFGGEASILKARFNLGAPCMERQKTGNDGDWPELHICGHFHLRSSQTLHGQALAEDCTLPCDSIQAMHPVANTRRAAAGFTCFDLIVQKPRNGLEII